MNTCLHPVRRLLIGALCLCAHLTATAQAPATSAPEPIPFPQIIEKADQEYRQLQRISNEVGVMPAMAGLDVRLKAQDEIINGKNREFEDLITTSPSLLELQEQESYWQLRDREYKTWRDQLNQRARLLESNLNLLESRQAQWEATLNQIQDPDALEAVFDRIRDVIFEIQKTRVQAREQLNALVPLQTLATDQSYVVTNILDRISRAEAAFQVNMFDRDSPPLWRARSAGQQGENIPAVISTSLMRGLNRSSAYIKTRTRALVFVFLVFLAALIFAIGMRQRIRSWVSAGLLSVADAKLFLRPVSLALLAALLTCLAFVGEMPFSLVTMIGLLFLIPLLRLLPPLIPKPFRQLVFALSALYLVTEFHNSVRASAVLEREVFAAGCLIAIVLYGWLTRPSRVGQLYSSSRWARTVIIGIRVSIVLLIVALSANIFGYFALAQVLGEGTIFSWYVVLIFDLAVRAASICLATFLKTTRARSLASIRLREEVINQWGWRVFTAIAFLCWLRFTLHLFTVDSTIMAVFRKIVSADLEIGAIKFSPWGLFLFFLVLLAGFTFARVAKFVLREDVFTRLPLGRGLPLALSSTAYYLILLAAFLIAMAVAGVELSKFTLLTGAFGVGIGFGMQNIVNNFVSGIILLFERPIHIGDVLEIGTLTGEVTRIGIRSSTVKTFQGAEVIVPNADFISNQVINWTLTDPRRRADLEVSAAYGTPPEKVIDLLLATAQANPKVLREPEPIAFFKGFGDSSLNFELRFWSPDMVTFLPLRSEVAIAVAKAMGEAGIKIPFPQRDLHLRTIEPAVKEEITKISTDNIQANVKVNSGAKISDRGEITEHTEKAEHPDI